MRRHVTSIGVGLVRESEKNLGTKDAAPRFLSLSLTETRADRCHMPTSPVGVEATPAFPA